MIPPCLHCKHPHTRHSPNEGCLNVEDGNLCDCPTYIEPIKDLSAYIFEDAKERMRLAYQGLDDAQSEYNEARVELLKWPCKCGHLYRYHGVNQMGGACVICDCRIFISHTEEYLIHNLVLKLSTLMNDLHEYDMVLNKDIIVVWRTLDNLMAEKYPEWRNQS